jgi:hypothetical protein
VELRLDEFDPRHQATLESCEPYLITHPGNLSALDLAPFGVKIQEQRIYDPTRLHSRGVIDALHLLDAFSFGGQDMLMPRWVLFDCGEFPGIVFGFGKRAAELTASVREAYQVSGSSHDDDFIPLSMWVALRCAEEGAWFGHNLSSANLVSARAWRGIATLTKALAVRMTKSTKQYGATQWTSGSIGLHLALGDLNLISAFTPAHTHPETLAYRIDVDAQRLSAPLRPGFSRATEGGERYIEAGDSEAVRALHDEIEAGAKFVLHRVERRDGAPQRSWLRVLA